jgi:hypothetical protein
MVHMMTNDNSTATVTRHQYNRVTDNGTVIDTLWLTSEDAAAKDDSEVLNGSGLRVVRAMQYGSRIGQLIRDGRTVYYAFVDTYRESYDRNDIVRRIEEQEGR